ncbi:c-type cytochrome [Planctomycetales bacterium ZRK34]|nr:c-type cytochrome [Planctomycetales bacterium ZRK34]
MSSENNTPAPDKQPQDQLLAHEYDGIQEYDNPTPSWWSWLFALSIVFSVCYLVYYHVGDVGATIYENLDAAKKANADRKFAGIGNLQPDAPSLLKVMNDPDLLAMGKDVFDAALCASCHGPNAAGLVGPNLTDDYYKNVKTLPDIVHVIEEGAGNGIMPAWKTRLDPKEIILVAGYVASLRGQNLKGVYPNDPYGQKIAPWPDQAP